MKWTGPYTIKDLLDGMAKGTLASPPIKDAAYLVSERRWQKTPSRVCRPLYVGGSTGLAPRFRTRIGDLIADMFGFFCDQTGHHSGGQSLHSHCREHALDPKNLWIGWVQGNCGRCLEVALHDKLEPELNKKKPPACTRHR
jgi:hypothetical protein